MILHIYFFGLFYWKWKYSSSKFQWSNHLLIIVSKVNGYAFYISKTKGMALEITLTCIQLYTLDGNPIIKCVPLYLDDYWILVPHILKNRTIIFWKSLDSFFFDTSVIDDKLDFHFIHHVLHGSGFNLNNVYSRHCTLSLDYTFNRLGERQLISLSK